MYCSIAVLLSKLNLHCHCVFLRSNFFKRKKKKMPLVHLRWKALLVTDFSQFSEERTLRGKSKVLFSVLLVKQSQHATEPQKIGRNRLR
jgi:hypothetical protein